MFISYIVGGALYILIYKIKQPCLYIEPPALSMISKGKYFLDFMCTHMLTIDMTNTIFVPAFSLFCLSFHEEAGHRVIRNLGIIGICQTLLWYFATFITRVSEVRPEWYVNIVPELAFCAGFTVLYIAPPA